MLSNVVSTEERTVLFSEPKTDPRSHVRVSEIINALSYAMDLTEGLPAGHYLRVCWIGMQIGRRLNLDSEKLSNLYYTLLLKDVGYSSNNANVSEFYSDDEDLNGESHYQSFYSQSVWGLTRFITKNLASTVSVCKRNSKLVWLAIQGKCLEREVAQARCKRGAAIAARMGFPLEVADGIHYLDEHYNGQGNLERKRGANIPLQSRIALLSQVLEEFYTIYGPQEALNEVRRCRGTWFDPKLVDVLESIAADPGFWEPLSSPNIQDLVRDLEPEERVSQVNQDQIDQIVDAFADVIDSKSPYTYSHSTRVAYYAVMIAQKLGFSSDEIRLIRRAALLHDIGKLGVSNFILDKPGKLTMAESHRVKLHPIFSEQILSRVAIFSELAFLAASHHERLDGTGYPRGLKDKQIPLYVRILTVADAFDALSSERPYQSARSVVEALDILEKDRDVAVDGCCLDALREALCDDALDSESFTEELQGRLIMPFRPELFRFFTYSSDKSSAGALPGFR